MICLWKLIMSAKTSSNSGCRGCFGTIRMHRYTNYIQYLMKLWLKCFIFKDWSELQLWYWFNNWKIFIEDDLCSTFNISAKYCSNSTFRDSFGILRTCRFQNCHWFSNLTNIWRSYWGFFRRQVKVDRLYSASVCKTYIASVNFTMLCKNPGVFHHALQ